MLRRMPVRVDRAGARRRILPGLAVEGLESRIVLDGGVHNSVATAIDLGVINDPKFKFDDTNALTETGDPVVYKFTVADTGPAHYAIDTQFYLGDPTNDGYLRFSLALYKRSTYRTGEADRVDYESPIHRPLFSRDPPPGLEKDVLAPYLREAVDAGEYYLVVLTGPLTKSETHDVPDQVLINEVVSVHNDVLAPFTLHVSHPQDEGDPNSHTYDALTYPAFGQPYSDNLETATDVDMFKFTVTEEGQWLSIELLTTQAMQGQMRIFDSNGNEISRVTNFTRGPGGTAGHESGYLEKQFLTLGTYYVGVSGAGNTTYDPKSDNGRTRVSSTDYTLTILDLNARYLDPGSKLDSPIGPVGVASSKAGADFDLSASYRVNIFSIAVKQKGQGAVITVSPNPIDTPDFLTIQDGLMPILRLFNANGQELRSSTLMRDKAGNPFGELRVKFNKKGTYYVGVSFLSNRAYNPITGRNVAGNSQFSADAAVTTYHLKVGKLRPGGAAKGK